MNAFIEFDKLLSLRKKAQYVNSLVKEANCEISEMAIGNKSSQFKKDDNKIKEKKKAGSLSI